MSRRKLIRADCARCGRSPAGGWARVLTTGRIVCAKCYTDLPFGPDNLVIDDGIARTWAETRQLAKEKAEQNKAKRKPKSSTI
jgi:hypothetical protein